MSDIDVIDRVETVVITKVIKPKKYAVLLHNDDFTPMEFVVVVLEKIFNKGAEDAVEVMLTIHKSGKAAVGLYSKEIAEQKVFDTEEFARINDYPLKATIEEQGED